MSKSGWLRSLRASTQQDWVASICCILMMTGFVFSRALLTIALVLMFLNALLPGSLRENVHRLRSNKFALLAALFFFTYALSGLWSDDKIQWWLELEIKLPFLLMPLAMLSAPLHKPKFQKVIIVGVLTALLGGIIHSLFYYYFNTSGRSIHFPLPTMDGDYIRFTLALVLSIPLALFLLLSGLHKPVKKSLRVFLIFWILAAIVYIHLQAAKSGLIGLYLTGLFYLIVALRKGKYPKLILSGFVIGLLVLILAALKLPNVESQIKRTKYEYEVWSSGDVSRYNKTASFIPRLNSYEVAWVVIKNNWLLGTGAGDIETTLSKNYNELFPSFVKRRQLIPHNQFLYTAVAVGLPLTAILILMVAFPFTQQLGHRIFTWPSGIVLFASLLIEAMLEVQYGVFVYLFFTLFWMSVFRREVGAEKAGLEPGYKN